MAFTCKKSHVLTVHTIVLTAQMAMYAVHVIRVIMELTARCHAHMGVRINCVIKKLDNVPVDV